MSAKLRELLQAVLVRLVSRDTPPGPIQKWVGSRFLRHFPGQLSCREFEDFVYDYHEQNLTPKQQTTFELHMRLCPMCRTHFRSYVTTIELGQRVCDDHDELPDMPEELVQAILSARSAR